MNGKYPEVSGRYYDRGSIRHLRAALRAVVQRNFESRCRVNFLQEGAQRFSAGPLSAEQEAIVGLFEGLGRQVEACAGLAQGLRTHFVTTNYDFVIETILDRVDGNGGVFDALHHGFTPRRIPGDDGSRPVTEHWLARNLLKLNGGFEIVPGIEGYALDYRRPPPRRWSRSRPSSCCPRASRTIPTPISAASSPRLCG
jgi:hypothetical protein